MRGRSHMNVLEMPAHELAGLVKARRLAAGEVVSQHLDHIRKTDSGVKAFITVTADEALAAAKRVDEKIARGETVGALAGVPVALKDNLCAEGTRTTCASRILKHFTAPTDAFVVKRLKEEDAVIVGKTNMDEFAMGSSCENSAFFPTRNPRDLERAPGGSSGGSAAAVAAGMAPIALGSDTGGSIRQPAALTGVVGFKPTYGMISRNGLVAFASSLDQIGPLCRNVRDAALAMDVIARKDPGDSTSVGAGHVLFLEEVGKEPGRPRLGAPKEFFSAGVDPAVRARVDGAIAAAAKAGAEIVDVSLPLTEYGIPAYYIIAPSEASSNLGRYTGVHYGRRTERAGDLESLLCKSRDEGFGPEVKRRIMLGTHALSSGYYDAYYLRALKVRRLIKEDFDRVFATVDAVIGPTSPIPAFKLGEKIADPLQMYLCDIFTVTANLAGIPGVSIPCGTTPGGLPVGLQILGRAFEDAKVLRIARWMETLLGGAV